MPTIHPSVRNLVDDSAAGLIDVADNIRQKNSVLGNVYDALGAGIHGSHTAESGVNGSVS
jgi:hypothetical protein